MSLNIFGMRAFHRSLPRLLRNQGSPRNPGIDKQLEALGNLDGEADFDDLESDFMEVHKSHKQYEIEMEQQREKTRLLLVKQKYFKEKFPNFLTYAEKEQMKLLHSRDPEEWTAEKIAESFPATPDLVKKVLEANWRPNSVKRIQKHDESVIKNWEILRNGGFPTLPPALKEHLNKFSDRTRNDLLQKTQIERNWQSRPELPKPESREFSSIITSCKKYNEQFSKQESSAPLSNENKQKSIASAAVNPSPNDREETYLLEKIVDKRPMRFQELSQYKLNTKNMSPLQNISNDGQIERTATDIKPNPFGRATDIKPNPFGTATNIKSNPNALPQKQEPSDFNFIEKFQGNEIVISQRDCELYEITTIKERIYIPKKLKKKGAIYKVEDCYYDDDGEFLYRVPGMTRVL